MSMMTTTASTFARLRAKRGEPILENEVKKMTT